MLRHIVKHYPLNYSFPHNRLAWCWLDVIERDGVFYVLLTEDAEYKGPSITNGVEFAIHEYHRLADLYYWPEPLGLVYVEHYEGSDDGPDEVILTNTGDRPSWVRLADDIAWDLLSCTPQLEQRWALTSDDQ